MSISIGVIGSRTFNDYPLMDKMLKKLWSKFPGARLVTGTLCPDWSLRSNRPPGSADRMAHFWAVRNGIDCTIYPADWEHLGRAAGFVRNTDIAENSDKIISFWDGKSRGTLDTMDKALALNKKVWVVDFEGNIYVYRPP